MCRVRYCNKVHETHPTHKKEVVSKIVDLYSDEKDETFKTDWEMSRDGVIACIMTEGPQVTVSGKRVEKYKEVVTKSSFERRKRFRSGTEMTEDKFREKYKHKPDVLKKAHFYTARVRNGKGKWVMQRLTKVYDQSDEDEYRFEEATGTEVRHSTKVDDGSVVLSENQASSVFEDTIASEFSDAGRGVSRSDCGDVPFTSHTVRTSSSSSRLETTEVSAPQVQEVSEEEDELSPFERMQQQSSHTPRKEKAAKKGKEGSNGSPGSTKNSPKPPAGKNAPNAPKGVDRASAFLMEEINQALDKLKEAETLDSINDDTIVSLVARAKTKSTTLTKKGSLSEEVSEFVDDLNDKRNILSAVSEFVKAARAWEKKKNKQLAVKVQEKSLALKTAGLTADGTPACVAVYDIFSSVYALAADGNWAMCIGLMDKETIKEKTPQLTEDKVEGVQDRLISDTLASCVRHHSESKAEPEQVFSKLTGVIQETLAIAVGAIPKKLQAAIIVLNASDYPFDDVQEALAIISKRPRDVFSSLLLC